MDISTFPNSVGKVAHHADLAGFPAVGAIILPIHAKANCVLTLADAAIAVALAIELGLIAHRAHYARIQSHRLRDFTVYERPDSDK